MIDLKNIDSIEKLSDYLIELNYAGNLDSIDYLEEEIIKLTKASKNFTLEGIREEIKTTQELIDEIEGREEYERTYTEKQRDDLIKTGRVKTSDFVMTGIDEFTYIGETNEDLTAALKENTTALLRETGKQLKKKAEKSDTWNNLQNEDPEKYRML
jgi:hypothetical protein